MNLYCPSCEYEPDQDVKWTCQCGHGWNAFPGGATCPSCALPHETTICPSCGETNDNRLWNHDRPPIGFIHTCENCRRPVSRSLLPQPTDESVKVLRYLTTNKFERFLRDSSIYLPRLDQFEDPWEGSLPKSAFSGSDEIAELGLASSVEGRRLWSKQFYVSCWNASNDESDAMWKLYCGSDGKEGVCVVSSYRQLSHVETGANSPLHLGAVTYIDYETGRLSFRDSFAPMMHKRSQFAFEQEVRIVLSNLCTFYLLTREQAERALDSTALGKRLRCDLSMLVTSILVRPSASQDYRGHVVELVQRYQPDLVDRIEWSRMRGNPDF
jgi:hypothetical protein